METFQILSDQFSHFQHLFHRWLAIFCIISSYIFDLSSSPHTWGIRGRILSIVFLPVHPHLCWAYPSLHLAAISQNGSSPHTWGIQPPGAHFVRRDRFIPTYVGHTRIKNLLISPRTVHPHIRGAYPQCGHLWHQRSRFIPTYVGHTAGRRAQCGGCTVHPHIRGAYGFLLLIFLGGGGSSPHTWGIPQSRRLQPAPARFIPTYVGHTPHPVEIPSSAAVHPHIRGAYKKPCCVGAQQGGSSPHTWGILILPAVQHQRPRFIPTYVGHTLDRRKKNGWFQPLLL